MSSSVVCSPVEPELQRIRDQGVCWFDDTVNHCTGHEFLRELLLYWFSRLTRCEFYEHILSFRKLSYDVFVNNYS